MYCIVSMQIIRRHQSHRYQGERTDNRTGKVITPPNTILETSGKYITINFVVDP